MAAAAHTTRSAQAAEGRRAAEDSETPEDDRVETSRMLVESLWALATNCLPRRVDEKHMAVEAGREMSREARRRRDLYEGYAEQVSNRVWSRTRLANLAEEPVTCPISGEQAYDTDHATRIQTAVNTAAESCAEKLREAGPRRDPRAERRPWTTASRSIRDSIFNTYLVQVNRQNKRI